MTSKEEAELLALADLSDDDGLRAWPITPTSERGRGMARRLINPIGETVKGRDLLELLKQQEYRCALSGRPLTPERAAMDHRIPLVRGGTHQLANIWIVDQEVNIAKSTLPADVFVLLCLDVVAQQIANGDLTLERVDEQACPSPVRKVQGVRVAV